MHICLIDLQWEGHHTQYVDYISRYLIDNDHEVTFLTSDQNPRVDEIQSIHSINVQRVNATRNHSDCQQNPIINSAYIRAAHIHNLGRIYYYLYNEKFDIIHFLQYDNTQLSYAVLGKLIQKAAAKVVMTLHRDVFLNQHTKDWLCYLSRNVTSSCMNMSFSTSSIDYLTVHTSSIKHRILGGVASANHSNVGVLPAPTPEPTQNISTTEARERVNIDTDTHVILFFGQIRHEKGLDRLFAALQGSEVKLTLVIAGNPKDYSQDQIATWAQQTPDSVSVDMRCKYIPEGVVDIYLSAADALILPYRRKVGISGPLRRAASVGTPGIVPAESDIGEIVRRHNIGVTFDSDSELLNILSNVETQLNDINQESLLAFARSRHWKKTGERLERIYRNLQ